MRIAKSITYEEAKELNRFSLLERKINKSIKKYPEGSISKIEDIGSLNYFLVIDCKDVSEDFGFEDKNNVGPFLFGSKEKNKKFIEHIKKKNSEPYFFKKIGLLYDISGCYLVATTKDSRKNITIYNTVNTVSCKLDLKDLPRQIKDMCDEYEIYNMDNEIKSNPYFFDIFNISSEERDKLIESIVSSLIFTNIPSPKKYPYYKESTSYENEVYGGLNVKDIIENKLGDIYDIPFLEQVLDSSIEDEDFEFCAKVRDRISELKNNI